MPKRHLFFLILILLTALAFRLVGIRFGEPLTVHPDEHNLIYHAMEAGARNGNPGWFEYPSGMIYFTLLVEGIRYVWTGAESASAFWTEYKSNPFPFHLWVRVSVAFFGVLGVYAIWLLGREWDRGRDSMRFLSWGGATILAVHFLHVRDSHFATVDIPLTTAVTLALWLILREFHRETTDVRRLLGVAFFVGICCGIKYTAAPLVFPLLYVGFENALRGEKVNVSLPWMVGSGSLLFLTVLAGFLFTTPYAVLDPKQFWTDIGYQFFTTKGHTPIYGGGQPFVLGYLQGPWMWGGGSLLGFFAFFGFLMAVLRHHPEDKVLLCFAIPYFLMIAFLSRVWGRWFLPMVVLQALWAVRFVAVYADHPWAVALVGPRTRKTIAMGLVLVMALCNAIPSLRSLSLMRETDSRVLAMNELEQHLDSEDVVLTTPFCPPLPDGVPYEVEDGLLSDREAYESGTTYSPDMQTPDELKERGVGFVLYSSYYWESVKQPFVVEAYPGAWSYQSFLEEVGIDSVIRGEWNASFSGIPLNAENIYAPTFHIWGVRRPGPDIRLYELPQRSKRSDEN